MGDEVINLVCLIPTEYMEAKMSVEEAEIVISESLNVTIIQLACFVPFFSVVARKTIKKNAFVPIQEIFAVLDSPAF